MSITASLIIPTHNRSASLKRMLEALELQSCPSQNFEVIIAADGCQDDTIEVIKNHKAAYRLLICELPGLGAATARNKGASMASGRYLIFADDDMELNADFIKEHIAAHTNDNTVVIGYSPFKLESKTGIQRMTLREWWEEKFQKMRKKGHRFKYDDLTSGNFSVSSELFKKVNGFNTALLCREDYELGFRLIKAGVNFQFAYTAKAFHRDEVTDLKRSLQRKKSEGMADIQIKKLHPDFVNRDAKFYLSQRSFSKSLLLQAIRFAPSLCDTLANVVASFMRYFETSKMHSSWLKMNYRLHQYWYLRGLMKAARSSKELYRLLADSTIVLKENEKLTVDLSEGLKKSEENIDRTRPLALDIFHATKFIGSVPYEAGAEPIKGIHLKRMLKDRFSDELFSAIYPDISVKNL